MSVYCGVATSLNETGSAFSPNIATRRNYAPAATLRLLNCFLGVEPKTKAKKIKI
ncbi:hypothetical protein [Nostoc sp. NMS8]|uniref:hypothetical protein n=1 Tax=Nostoc sp. NMS8 TaxID=2815392 RepID=UPI0025FE8CD1|nr:hypothetical protein [Nostoc sp. NMS8]MBN3959948.1 hypothetical protein [Nostoc sp. NMS8]